jgi:hypothetical protein
MTFGRRILLMMVLLNMAVLDYALAEDEHGWFLSQRFLGTSNAAGRVLGTTSTGTYIFSQHFSTYVGLPVYFTKQRLLPGAAIEGGIGNVYTGLAVTAENSALRYFSNFTVTVPTGSASRGFSTGRLTADLDEYVQSCVPIADAVREPRHSEQNFGYIVLCAGILPERSRRPLQRRHAGQRCRLYRPWDIGIWNHITQRYGISQLGLHEAHHIDGFSNRFQPKRDIQRHERFFRSWISRRPSSVRC